MRSGADDSSNSTASASAAPTPAARFRWALRSVVPPLVVFLVAHFYLIGVAAIWHFDPLTGSLWTRWDSFHYLTIADRGYTVYPSDGSEGYAPGVWMGNAAWLPGYPMLIRLLSSVGIAPTIAAVSISWMFRLLSLIVLWNGPLREVRIARASTPPAFLCLLLAGVWLGFVYQHAVFPISMCCFWLLLACESLRCERWMLAGIAGACAGFTYSTGCLISGVALIWVGVLVIRREKRFQDFVRAFPAIMLPWLGFVAALAVERHQTGRWDAFFLVQQKYGSGLHNPLSTLLWHLQYLFVGDTLMHLAAIQNLLAAILVLTGVIAITRRWRTTSPLDQICILYAVIYWAFPLLMGISVSSWRAMAMLTPATPLLRRLPIVWMVSLVAILMLLGGVMAIRFFAAAAI